MPLSKPKLLVSAGPSPSALSPIRVNADLHPFHISSSNFEGDLVVRIRDFHGEPTNEGEEVLAQAESGYFDKYTETTWSIQVRGKFKGAEADGGWSADEVLWGNTFDGPIYDYLPYGTTAALHVLKQIDPSLEHDLKSSKPWALSPFLATMNTVTVSSSSSPPSPGLGDRPGEDITPLLSGELKDHAPQLKENAGARRRYLADKEKRKQIKLDGGKEGEVRLIDAEFANGWIDFNDLSLKIGNVLTISLAKYWNGQPVRYVCRSRDGKHDFFTVVFDIVEGVDPIKKDGKPAAEVDNKKSEDQVEVEDKDELGVD